MMNTPPLLSADRGLHGDDGGEFSRQLAVVSGMLCTLETLTTAGQHHDMSKVVSFLEEQTGRAGRGLSVGNQRAFADLMRNLTRESERMLPDVRTFSHAAEGLVALLEAIAQPREGVAP